MPSTSRTAEHPPPDEGKDPLAGCRAQGLEVGERAHPPELVEVVQHARCHEGWQGSTSAPAAGEDLGGTPRRPRRTSGSSEQPAAGVEVHAHAEASDVAGSGGDGPRSSGGRLVQSRTSGRLMTDRSRAASRAGAGQRAGGPAEVGRVERYPPGAGLEGGQAQPGARQPDRATDVGTDVERPVATGRGGPGPGARASGRQRVFQGERVTPCRLDTPEQSMPQSGMTVDPRMTPPDSRTRSVTGASASGRPAPRPRSQRASGPPRARRSPSRSPARRRWARAAPPRPSGPRWPGRLAGLVGSRCPERVEHRPRASRSPTGRRRGPRPVTACGRRIRRSSRRPVWRPGPVR